MSKKTPDIFQFNPGKAVLETFLIMGVPAKTALPEGYANPQDLVEDRLAYAMTNYGFDVPGIEAVIAQHPNKAVRQMYTIALGALSHSS